MKNEHYESAIVKTETRPDYTTEGLSADYTLKLKTDTVFLKVLIYGIKSLYALEGYYWKDQFYIQKDSSFELLIYKKYFKEQNGAKIIAEDKRFLGQLAIYLQGCPMIQSRLAHTEYTQQDIEKVFLYYYQSTQSEIKFHKEKKVIRPEFGIFAGTSLTYLRFHSHVSTDPDFSYLEYTGYHPSVNFSTGLFMNLILPKHNNRWSVNNELIFSSYKVNSQHNDFVYYTKYTITKSEIGYAYLKMNNMIQYKFPVKGLFIFFNAGFSNGFTVSETNYRIMVSKYDANEVKKDKAIEKARPYEQGYLIGTGVRYKKYSLGLRYERGNGFSKYENLDSKTTRYFLLLGYKF